MSKYLLQKVFESSMWTLGAIWVPVDSGAAAPGNQPNPMIIVTTLNR
jgi:hypothetical protein